MSEEHGIYSGVVDIARNGVDEVIRLRALNAELVEALREMWELWHDDPAYGHEAADRARELLAKVEDSNGS